MKRIGLVYFWLLLTICGFSQYALFLDICGVKVNGGLLYISLFNSEQTYNEKVVFFSLVAPSPAEKIKIPLELPDGEYFFSIYQDANKNGKLDVNLIGIPKEAFGFSKYDGKSIPGNFERHKVLISPTVKKVNVQLYKI